ncbi:GAF domain-containing protein [Methanothermobacter sp. DP]|uniref:GAF domain-containing protein n=1 Tax=unclassified Methanothermobacter TaxID=2631116 RepID=UPI002AA56627|nr:GAF domain-containing protein [Methanothermobacter sp. DP]
MNDLREKLESVSSVKEASDIVFDEIKMRTGSRYCYVAYVDPENGDSVGIRFSHLTDYCSYYEEMGEARFRLPKSGRYGGLLGYSLDTGESFFTNNPAGHPAAHGIPEGHIKVSRFLSLAVKDDEGILGQIVAADPPENYNEGHLRVAEKIAEAYAGVLRRFYRGEIPLR